MAVQNEENGVVWGSSGALKVIGKCHQKFFFDFGSQNGDLWCILGAIFCSSAKNLRGRKDTVAPLAAPRDRRHC